MYMTSINYPRNITSWKYVSVYGMDFRPCLLDMANTTTKLDLWDWFKNESPPNDTGYTYWSHPNIKKISDGLEVNEHSGATFGYCMRQMQFIAKHGFDKWNHIINQQPE